MQHKLVAMNSACKSLPALFLSCAFVIGKGVSSKGGTAKLKEDMIENDTAATIKLHLGFVHG